MSFDPALEADYGTTEIEYHCPDCDNDSQYYIDEAVGHEREDRELILLFDPDYKPETHCSCGCELDFDVNFI